jgi:hypothetical protein
MAALMRSGHADKTVICSHGVAIQDFMMDF